MIKIAYPPYQPKIETRSGKEFIFDEGRKKWVVLTPEEWVRQNFIQYLIQIKKYPAALISIEKEILLGDVKKRFDIVVFNRLFEPWMLIECKEMNVSIDEKVLGQALRYQSHLQAKYIVITNGTQVFLFETSKNELKKSTEFPEFEQ